MVFFFYGPNTYAARRKLREMAAAYIQKSGSNFGLERIDGQSVSLDSLTSALQASPFLANTRLVIVENLGSNKVVAEKATAVLENIPDSTVVAFYDPEVDQRTTYFKTMSKQSKAVKFDKLNPAQLTAWTKREVQLIGGHIDSSITALLVDRIGDDQWRLAQEISKLVSYDANITTEAVKLLVVASQTQSIFDLVDAMSTGRLAQALIIFRQLISERTNEFYILTMVTWQLRNLLLAKTSGGLSAPELARQAGMSPYVATKALARQHSYSEKSLKLAFIAAVDTDYAIKSGRGQPEQLVESLIYRVATGSRE